MPIVQTSAASPPPSIYCVAVARRLYCCHGRGGFARAHATTGRRVHSALLARRSVRAAHSGGRRSRSSRQARVSCQPKPNGANNTRGAGIVTKRHPRPYLVEVVVVVHVLGAASEDTSSARELALRVGLRLAPDGVAGPFALLNLNREEEER